MSRMSESYEPVIHQAIGIVRVAFHLNGEQAAAAISRAAARAGVSMRDVADTVVAAPHDAEMAMPTNIETINETRGTFVARAPPGQTPLGA